MTKNFRKLTEQKLKKMFTVHGVVVSCTLVKDSKTGESKGFGFVEMAEDIDGGKSIKALDGTVVDGKKIRVKEADSE